MTVKRPLSAPVVLLALAAAAPCVLAGPNPNPLFNPRVTVRFDDLNTSTTAGNRVLYGRISAAATSVCSSAGGWYPTEHWAREDCYRATMAHVVTQLNVPLLTALHLQRTRRAPVVASLAAGKW